jgi:heat shock protein HspQ
LNNVVLTVDPNYGNSYSWRDVRELCKGLEIVFKNQTFVSVIKEYRKRFFNKNDRVVFDKAMIDKVKAKSNNVCRLCSSDGDLEIDHIKPLCKGGSNHISNLQALCKGCHREKTQREQETGSFIKEEETMSSFNCQTKEIINSLYAKSHAFVETLREPDDKYYYKMYKLDINKCRRNCLYHSKYEFPVFSVMDEVEEFHGKLKPGLFFVETDNYIPLRGSGWYSQPVVDYCLEEKLIAKSDIKFAVYATGSIKRNYFNEFIDNLIDVLSPYDTSDNKFSKLAINSIIGTFKPNEERISYRSMFMTTSPDNAFHHYLSYNNSVIDNLEIDDQTYYHVFRTSKNQSQENETTL